MKKIVLTITLAAAGTILAMAGPIGKQAALYTAKAYMLAKGKNINEVQKPFKAARKGAAPTDEEAYYYVFNAGGDNGYVIVSGDDRVEPILGYVDKGSFDPNNIPENMRSWLQGYADQIKYIVDNNIQPNDPIIKKRNKVQGTKHSVGELLTTRWNQGHPYNLTCPDYYKEEETTLTLTKYPATGCTATAMAQVIAFYKFPEKLKTQIPAYTQTYRSKDGKQQKSIARPAIARNSVIDWENMRDTYNCNDSHVHDKQDTAVANLMRYCGQAVKMGYGPSSGANFDAEVFIKYFGFDNSAYRANRSDYSIDDWFDMLYKDIAEGYPVCFAGFSSGGGHAFVIDGFDGENLFHLNWGWGGGSNGWFLVSILNPGDTSGIGASSSSDGYSMGQYALLNLRLPDTNTADTYLFIKDVSVTNKTAIKATFENRTGASGSYHMAVVRYDENGELVTVGNPLIKTGFANKATETKTFNIKDKLPEGTYKLSPASKSTRSDEWRPRYNLRNHYIEAVVDSEGNVTLTPVDISNGDEISIDTIVFPGTRIAGKEQEVKVTFRNNGNEYFREIHLFASKTSDKVYMENRSMVAVRKGETVDVSYFFTPEETGTYNLWFCTSNNGSGEVGTGTMEVITEAEAVKATLAVNSFSISNLVSGVAYGNCLVGRVAIKNNAKEDYNGAIRLQIWSQKVGEGTAWSGSSQTHEVNIMAGKVGSVEFNFDNLNEGYYYHIAVNYVNQDGSLAKGGIWDHSWEMKSGIAMWKTDGTISGKAYSASMMASTACGVYANCSKNITRMTPNRNNPNAIYAFGANMTLPASLDTTNVVSGSHADRIKIVNDKPYYIPVSFTADSASFSYTFPETENGAGWHAFTMPFAADSIYVDDVAYAVNDSALHFWIYEFAAQGDNGEVIFAPAAVLRGNTPYIIAGDAEMAGKTIAFRSLKVPFFKTGSDKMIVTSSDYHFHGNTLSPKVKDCYVLNAEGTAFEYATINTTLSAMAPYFTTTMSAELRPESIVLPKVPEAKGDQTGISGITSSNAQEGLLYNLAGQRISKMQKGINIVNGKKILK